MSQMVRIPRRIYQAVTNENVMWCVNCGQEEKAEELWLEKKRWQTRWSTLGGEPPQNV